tara:strand:+ start:45086 stop:45427 length:342 start_codon:yes stop_codon:yes gene_type:complete
MPEIRPAILEDFAKSKGAKVLLMTRATGGLGLNITCANVVIQCSPWWKREWELQARDRAWREGQSRAVVFVCLQAEGGGVEDYKIKRRNGKDEFTQRALARVTRKCDEPLPEN